MATIQCKMCGGSVELPDGVTTGECSYCGSVTTFPRIDSEQKEHLYTRAEHFRQANNFDKAVASYEALLNLDGEDPEAYWGLLISRYGIEYVEDPATHERVPTCHRVQFDSILADSDYLNALKFSSGYDHEIYEKEAQRISEIQKSILRISAQEKPYDVFICYKEATDAGTRTKDSTLAQDIYYQLTNQGLKVFFSRITLEDKLGQQYEPYIFAALNSAKVMLVIGSKKEYFEAVWVKNEWSRFLALMKKDRSRLLIPCYRDMDPYDIPEELSMFQCQDMSKIGFMQDILRGVMKVVKDAKPSDISISSNSISNNSSIVSNLIKRISVLMQQQKWDDAKSYCNKALESEPENAELYLLLCMINCKKCNETDLPFFNSFLSNDKDFQMALQFASPERKNQIKLIQIKNRDHYYKHCLNKCISAAGVSTLDELTQSDHSLDEDTFFQNAVRVAPEAEKERLLQLQSKQIDYYIQEYSNKTPILSTEDLEAYDITDLAEEFDSSMFYFEKVIRSASRDQREKLEQIVINQCIDHFQVSSLDDLESSFADLSSDYYYQKLQACASPELKEQLESIETMQHGFLKIFEEEEEKKKKAREMFQNEQVQITKDKRIGGIIIAILIVIFVIVFIASSC